jgi:polyisoprenoid-binding protein YceI
MTRGFFQGTIIGMFLVIIVTLGIDGFLIWNQRPDHEPSLVRDNSAHLDMTGDTKESDPPPDPRSAEGAKAPRADRSGPGKKDKPDSEPAEAAKSYQIDTDASRVYVKVGSATRIGHPHGVEGKLKSGKVTLGAGGELVFDMGSFQADTQEARKKVGLEGKKLSENEAKKVNGTMRSADVLDVEKFPTATYKIIAIKPAEKQDAGAPGLYEVNGRFTLHGAEQPLQFKAKLERTDKEGVLRLTGAFAVRQTDYGMTPYSAAGGLAKVANELEILGELVLGPTK